MACEFNIPFSGTVEEIYQKAKAAVEKQGGNFSGDTSSGEFSLQVFGKISGSYTVGNQQLNIIVTEKPMMIPCSAIESALKAQIK